LHLRRMKPAAMQRKSISIGLSVALNVANIELLLFCLHRRANVHISIAL
jgi:hypothetical protein